MSLKKLSSAEKNKLITILRQKKRDAIPPILYPLWQPYRKKMITGGRGSGKTQTACRIAIRQASNEKMRILWAREIMESIKESIWSELAELIPLLGYPGWDIKETYIRNKKTGSYFAFKGLKDIKAAQSMKGYSNFDRLIVEEAQAVPKDSWIMAVPTIRKKGSEIWAIFNRYDDLDPVYELYCMNPRLKEKKENGYTYLTDGETIYIECNWRDNPYFPDVLYKEMMQMREDDYDLCLHVYENHPIAQLEKAVMSRVLIDIATKTIKAPNGPQVIGVDVARHGDDFTKAYERRGDVCKKITEVKGEAPIKTAREIAAKADTKYTIINVDNGGLGAGGLIDSLKEFGFKNVNEINYGGSAKDKKQYVNTVTEMYFECKEKLKTASIPDDIKLRQDLTGRLYGYDNQQRKIIEKKSEFKKRYHRSPDDGDAVVMCFYDPGNKITLDSSERQAIKKAVMNRRFKRQRRFIR